MGNGRARQRRVGQLRGAFVALALSAGAAAAGDVCAPDTIELRGDWGKARFTVEIADDAEEQRVGLMNRPSMPIGSGMLFVYDTPRALSFWMRNTLIPLDMLFIDGAGVVQHIHHEAIPLDETSIFGGDNLTSVLEINGGLARRMGIKVGSQVRHPSYGSETAAWPC